MRAIHNLFPPSRGSGFPCMGEQRILSKDRLDRLLVARGLVSSREVATRMIMAGLVRVDDQIVDKQGKQVRADAEITIVQRGPSYVSRAGEKLSAALDEFRVPAAGKVALDVGCSTGGFTDCLLQRGASRIYAVDVGYGQIDWQLRQDPRVVLLERTNIRYVAPSSIPEPIDLAVIDVSFISVTLVLPCVARFLRSSATVLALVKPQFEVGKGKVGRGGIVRDDDQRYAVTDKVVASAATLGLELVGVMDSAIRGRKGNREIMVAWRSSDLA